MADLLSDERSLRMIIDEASSPFIAMDRDSVILEWNQQAKIQFGWSKEEAVGRKMPELIMPERFRSLHYRGVERYLASGEAPFIHRKIEVPVLHKSGREILVQITINAATDSSGQEIFWTYLEDISERKLVEKLTDARFNAMHVLAAAVSFEEGMGRLIQFICEIMRWQGGVFWECDPNSSRLRYHLHWFSEDWFSEEFSKEFAEKFGERKVSECLPENLQREAVRGLAGPFDNEAGYLMGEGLPGLAWRQMSSVVWSMANEQPGPKLPGPQPRRLQDLQDRFLSFAQKRCGVASAVAFPVGAFHNFKGVFEFFSSEDVQIPALALECLTEVGHQCSQFILKTEAEERFQNLYRDLERQVAERTRDISLIMKNAPIIFWSADANGILTVFDGRGLETSNIRRADFIGQSIWTLSEKRSDVQAFLKRAFVGEELSGEMRLGDRWYRTTATPVRDESGAVNGLVGVSVEVTDRVRAEQEIKAARDRAEEASRAKSQFLANMSHEIRTPLGAILGFAELMATPGQSQEEFKSWVGKISANGSHLLKIVDQILDLSKVEAGKMLVETTEVATSDLLADLDNGLGRQAREKGLLFTISIDEGVPEKFRTDVAKLQQIFNNIIGNAIKFTANGFIQVHVSQKLDGRLAFEVSDSGIGLSREEAEKLFRPFSQADSSLTRRYGGTGLGLALSRSLSKLLGGDVTLVKSERAKGSVFEITLTELAAMADAGMASDPPEMKSLSITASSATRPTSLDNVSVLLVEDSVDNQLLFSRFLKSAGASVSIASNGREGLEKARQEDFDVVLMDIQMPVMDGIAATSDLRRGGYRKPIVALTAHAMKEERSRCLRAGFDGYITKPVKKDDLLAEIAGHAGRGGVDAM